MSLAYLTMSKRELDRAQLMLLIHERRRTQAQVAEQLGLTVRHVERLFRAYKDGGAAALVSKKRGRPSARRLSDATRAEVLRVVRERYADFGPTLAHEKLTELHAATVSVETLRQWMIGAGIWLPRAQRRKGPHPPRYRRPCFGELVQIDGCDHEWFEERGPRCVLLVYVDDATSRIMELRFVVSESTFDYFAATRSYIEKHGKPVAFYSDKASIFRVNVKAPPCGPNATQFVRAMDELNIELLCANSPQAKGRVERAHQTLQDRLVKELRLRGIDNAEGANRFAAAFVGDYNERFGREPANPHDAHRPVRSDEDLEQVFRWKEQRTLSQNLALHYRQCIYILAKSPQSLALRGKVVQVHELDDGTVKVWDGAVELPATEFRKGGGVRPQDIADNKFLASTLERVRKAQIAEDLRKLREAKMTKREQARLRASMVERAAPDDAAGLAAERLPAVPATEPSNEKAGRRRRSTTRDGAPGPL
jgi:transposase